MSPRASRTCASNEPWNPVVTDPMIRFQPSRTYVFLSIGCSSPSEYTDGVPKSATCPQLLWFQQPGSSQIPTSLCILHTRSKESGDPHADWQATSHDCCRAVGVPRSPGSG